MSGITVECKANQKFTLEDKQVGDSDNAPIITFLDGGSLRINIETAQRTLEACDRCVGNEISCTLKPELVDHPTYARVVTFGLQFNPAPPKSRRY